LTHPYLKHKPCLEKDRGEMMFVYAIAILPDNIKKFIVLTKSEIDDIKKTSKALNSSYSPWKGAFQAEMWRKSAVKKLYKYLPQTERMSTAVHVLNEHEGLRKEEFTSADDLMKRVEEAEVVEETTPEKPQNAPQSTKPQNKGNTVEEANKQLILALKKKIGDKMTGMSKDEKTAMLVWMLNGREMTVDLMQHFLDKYDDFNANYKLHLSNNKRG